jgi:hypothetical protein
MLFKLTSHKPNTEFDIRSLEWWSLDKQTGQKTCTLFAYKLLAVGSIALGLADNNHVQTDVWSSSN